MKQVILLILLVPIIALAGGRGGHYSHVPGSGDGWYVGPDGIPDHSFGSHKGETYVNPNTNDDYRDRKDGTPY